MGIGSIVGGIIGGAGGFILGGPAGAIKGAGLGYGIGSSIDQRGEAKEQRQLDEQTLAELQQYLGEAAQKEAEYLAAGNAEAAAMVREAVAAQLAIYDDLIDNVHPERVAALREWFKEAKAPFVPFHTAGVNALGQQMNMLGIGTAAYDPNIISSRPSYQFVKGEGLKAVDRTASARAGALSGRAVKEAERYASGLASQEFQNEFARLGTISSLGLEAGKGISNAALATQREINQAYSDLFNVYSGKAGAYGAQGEALANIALSNAQGLIDISQNSTNALLGITGADLTSQQNYLNQKRDADANLVNNLIGISTIFSGSGRGGTTSSGGGQQRYPTLSPTSTPYTLVGNYNAGFT